MDTYIVKNEAIKTWMGFTLSFGSLNFFFPQKKLMLEIVGDSYWVRKRPLIVS